MIYDSNTSFKFYVNWYNIYCWFSIANIKSKKNSVSEKSRDRI